MTTDKTDNTSGMSSSQPYLIRAIYEWIVDNDLTPYLMVDATKRGTIVPEDYLDELGRIILNISPSATSGLLIANEEVTFSARFSGQSMSIVVPTYSIRAIYARENGQGMMFDESNEPGHDVEKKRVTLEAVDQHASTASGSVASVKTDVEGQAEPGTEKSDQTSAEKAESTTSDKGKGQKGSDDKGGRGKGGNGKGKKGSHLKVVK